MKSTVMDVQQCVVFCASCNDYVYDADLERILESEKCRVAGIVSRIKGGSLITKNKKKKQL